VCKYTGCKFLHTTEYLAMKEPDIGEHRKIKMENRSFNQCCGFGNPGSGSVIICMDPDLYPDLNSSIIKPKS
jgi:hypothetical protein